jgi:exosortase
VELSQPQTRRYFPLAWFGALILLCYAPVIVQLIHDWQVDEDMGHGFFVPAVSAYIVWQKWGRLKAMSLVPNNLGLIIVGLGALQLLVATLGMELFLSRSALVMTLTGMVVYFGGWPLLKELFLPLFLLLFMIPLPAVIYNQITFPLQLLASKVAETVLWQIGIPVLREGNILELASQRLSVVEACSGIRSLLSLSFLAIVYAHMFDEKTWMKPVLLFAAVPVAVITNAGRVTLTGILSEVNPDLVKGFLHSAEGWLVFTAALAIMVLVHWGINRIYEQIHART